MEACNGDENDDDFPFDVIVVTSPDAAAARAAESGPLACLDLPDRVKVLSTSDPFDVRCGSGGGTLAALDIIEAEEQCTVLIVHAGGQSSRCPTQMVLGKAWTSLPLRTSIGNPTFLLIHSLALLLKNIPRGSVVVAASDVLLTLNPHSSLPSESSSIDWQLYQDQVIGLAVPAPLDTATNHGVFMLPYIKDENPQVMPVETFLQKPSLEKLQNDSSLHFLNKNNQSTPCAWIDTGVVMFSPKAAAALKDLQKGILKCCTQRGLMELYEKQNYCHSRQDFYQEATLKVELYSHLLMALSTTTSCDKNAYLSRHDDDDLPQNVLEGIYKALSPHALHALVMPEGQFMHLGTTRELVDFLSVGANWKDGEFLEESSRCRNFGKQLGLVRRSGSAIFAASNVDSSSSAVVLNTLLLQCHHDDDNATTSVGQGIIVEHTSLVVVCSNGMVRIGANCLVSSVRGEVRDCMDIPNDTCLQVLPLQGDDEYVYMFFGVHDDIKMCNTLYGSAVTDVLEWMGLSRSDIWDEPTSDDALWNAKIHPVVKKSRYVEFQSLFAWVAALKDGTAGRSHLTDDDEIKSSLERWKTARRLSFAEIRDVADANAEFQYRNKLEAKIKERKQEHCHTIQQVLLSRQHHECDLEYLVNDFGANRFLSRDFWQVLVAMDDVVREGINRGQYDVSSRAFMVMSGLLNDLVNVTECMDNVDEGETHFSANQNEILTDIDMLRSSLATDEQMLQSCEKLLSYRNELLKEKGHAKLQTTPTAVMLHHCASCLESAAFALIHKCVSDQQALVRYRQRTRPAAPLDTWVIASAPVRIDLSGGWSDTPPLSYEYGGAVACLAVTVDGRKPLSSQCRLVSGGKGLSLCTESRDITGKLSSETKVRIDRVGGLADYKNPRSDCALIKCALILFGLVPADKVLRCEEQDLQPYINTFCGSNVDVGMEIVSTSLLPHGSGMGTSSILGGCVLAAIGRCIGVDLVGTGPAESNVSLIHAVLTLEQLLSTGGGWQDQVGGLIGGLKLATSEAHVIPLRTSVERIPIDPTVRNELDQRLILAYSGKTRIAKNILQNVLRRWSRRSSDICKTVEGLVIGANAATEAVQEGDLDKLGRCLNSYWQQKKIMAGDDSGAEPAVVQEILAELLKRNEIVGGSLCGAGGGGFMLLLAAAGRTGAQIQQTVENELSQIVKDVDKFTWHECRVSQEGLKVQVEEATTRGE